MIESRLTEQVFNSAFETGIRALCALSAGHPNEYDLQQLLAFDHVIVHSGDMPSGPPSLHPNVKQRNGELLVRRPIVLMGLALMESKSLIVTRPKKGHICYASTDLAPVFLESLENSYLHMLKVRATWAVTVLEEWGDRSFFGVFNAAFDRWSSEFQIADISLGGA
ncbi:MAG TPA: ABC-three component system middle component 2 [Sphingopyxis sp.]|uniref:ABC-three component system middle component 2 n=1 Tax=Sphingopyxis sp. TaxID=1908224 RepID=UPI002BD84651|nr:ABC-three component system middle component 2 [Sphingopyxis sp.]HWW59133.1 ABC-three component system middle component 2 [Sphingopyxis sp.]